ncbi:MAG: pyridoxamine 5'-phosphate oxidase family protein [Cyclobacteriaceae bacterium]|nr:pyridoxamine 5'-phosphate oxidase family protein [Cyclobacteriaceae bacterium]
MNNDHNNEDLSREDAIDKLKELVKHNSMCMFTTKLEELPLHSRPMSVAKVCDQGNLWFLSPGDSNKNMNISEDSRVQLFSTNASDSEFLTVYGNATISRDKKKIEELWSPLAKAWFTQGKDDPRITVIKVTPEDAHYWDTKNGKMVSLVKIVAAAAIGHTMDGGVEGSLSVR